MNDKHEFEFLVMILAEIITTITVGVVFTATIYFWWNLMIVPAWGAARITTEQAFTVAFIFALARSSWVADYKRSS